jgi:hypothetical protein
MTSTFSGTRARTLAVAIGLLAVMAVGCTSLAPGRYPGGTYSVDATLPSKTIQFAAGGCSIDVTTDEVYLGSALATVPPFTVTSGQTSVTVPDITISIPAGNTVVGNGTVACDGQAPEVVEFQLEFGATVSAQSGTMDTATKEITLDDATVNLQDATLLVDGLPPIPVPSVEVELATITLEY